MPERSDAVPETEFWALGRSGEGHVSSRFCTFPQHGLKDSRGPNLTPVKRIKPQSFGTNSPGNFGVLSTPLRMHMWTLCNVAALCAKSLSVGPDRGQ